MALAMLMRAAEMVENEELYGDSVVPQYSGYARPHPYARPGYQSHSGYTPEPVYYGAPISGARTDGEGTDDDLVPDASTRTRKAPSRGSPSNINAHNEVEKRRRAFLTRCYNELHHILPTIAGTKASNATVLRTATDHIKALEREEKMLLAAKRQQLQIREQILARRARVASSMTQHRQQQQTLATVPSDEPAIDEDDTAMVPDRESRPVSPNMSPKEDLTQLASPIRKVKQLTKETSGSGGPMRRAARNRVRNIMMVN